jgi:hypothetical protein
MKIEYDVNVYVPEQYNADTGQTIQDKKYWKLQVYDYNDGDAIEADAPFMLTAEESFAMNFEETGHIDALDGWMTMDFLMEEYADQMSDRIREYLNRFPTNTEDIRKVSRYI